MNQSQSALKCITPSSSNYKERILPIEGQVSILVRTFCFCSQAKWFTLSINEQCVSLFKDKTKLSIYMQLPLNSILAVNKRQVIQADLNAFSIYYQSNQLTNEVKELKLKTKSNREMLNWIYKIRLIIDQSKYTFQISKNQVNCYSYLNGLFQNSKNLYISINIIEFIIKRQLMLKLVNRLSEYICKEKDDNNSGINSSNAFNPNASTFCLN